MTTLLPISTRGAGMATVALYEMLSTCEYFFEAVPHICKFYRAVLGLLELKLTYIQEEYEWRLSEGDKELQYVSEVPIDFEEVVVSPKPIAKLINAIGYLKHETGDYLPAVHKRWYENDRYIPRTDNILISNLRETVVALSDANTPLAYRRSFFQNNPIPGARFENNLLLNPDEIIPKDYSISEEHLGADMNEIMPQVDEMESHFGNAQICETFYQKEGQKCLLITSDQSNLAIPSRRQDQDINTYYKQCLPTGNVKKFWSRGTLKDPFDIEGSINLLGELPSMSKFMTSFYRTRDLRRCENPALVDANYKDIWRRLYPPYCEYSMPINTEDANSVTRLMTSIRQSL